MGGPVGLDYSAMEPTFRLLGIPADRWPDLFDDIRVMEQADIRQMSADRDAAGRNAGHTQDDDA